MQKFLAVFSLLASFSGFSRETYDYDYLSISLANAMSDCLQEFTHATKSGARILEARYQNNYPGETFTITFGVIADLPTEDPIPLYGLIVEKTPVAGSKKMTTKCVVFEP